MNDGFSLLAKSENPKRVKVRMMNEPATRKASESPANAKGKIGFYLPKSLLSGCRNVGEADSHFFKKVRIGSASSRRTRCHPSVGDTPPSWREVGEMRWRAKGGGRGRRG